MKKTIIALIASVGIVGASIPAYAGDDAAYAIGGVIGGLILGDILSNNHRHQHNVYVYEQPQRYVQVCRTDWVGYYDYYGRYVQQPRQVCEWVPR